MISAADELSAIRNALVPWLRHWDKLDDHDEPESLPDGVLERLSKLTAEHPDYEPALREAVTVHLLCGNRIVAAGLLLLLLRRASGSIMLVTRWKMLKMTI